LTARGRCSPSVGCRVLGLDHSHPGAAASFREWLDATLTRQHLGVSGALQPHAAKHGRDQESQRPRRGTSGGRAGQPDHPRFRRSGVRHLINVGNNPHVVMAFSGHRTPSMPRRYHLNRVDDVRRAAQRGSADRGAAAAVLPLVKKNSSRTRRACRRACAVSVLTHLKVPIESSGPGPLALFALLSPRVLPVNMTAPVVLMLRRWRYWACASAPIRSAAIRRMPLTRRRNVSLACAAPPRQASARPVTEMSIPRPLSKFLSAEVPIGRCSSRRRRDAARRVSGRFRRAKRVQG